MRKNKLIALLTVILAILMLMVLNTYFNFGFISRRFPPYPYNPEVWGNVADWAMVMVTVLTAYFLYHTLQSQIEALGSQQKSVENQSRALLLEQRKFKASIEPFFSGKYRTSSEDYVSLVCKFRNGHARKVKITFKNIVGHHSYITRVKEPIIGYGTQMLGNKLEDDEFELNFHLQPRQAEYNIQFYMVYYDVTGENGYIQQIRYMHSETKFTYGEIKEYIQGKTNIPAEFEVIPYL